MQLLGATSDAGRAEASGRVSNGLVAIYDFRPDGSGLVRDRTLHLEPVDLKVGDPTAVRWTDGALEFTAPTRIRSTDRLAKIANLVRVSGEITVEAWIDLSATDAGQSACILALSNGSDQVNFELRQRGRSYRARFRTSLTARGDGAQLAVAAGESETGATQVVFTRDRTGRSRIFLDGTLSQEGWIPGSASDWEKTTLTLGNGAKGRRPWLGSVHLLAVYGRDLLPAEVARNREAGSQLPPPEATRLSESAVLFETEVAPLLASRCLDCHDSSVRQGGLDLTKRASALEGGDRGNAIKPGDASSSLLWLMVQSGAMPQSRPPLSDPQKQVLRDWIDGGASWTREAIGAAARPRVGSGADSWVRRLTAGEYVETVRAALGVDLSDEARDALPAEVRADGFENTAYNLTVDLAHVEAYAKLAAAAATRAEVGEFVGQGGQLDERWIRAMGRRVLRGPLSEREVGPYRNLADQVGTQGGTVDEAARIVLEAMLQSPRFLYRIEQQRGDGTAWPADAFELASRLSYVVWGGPPDDELAAAAESGSLTAKAEVRRQVRRMLDDHRAVARSLEFIGQWLDVGRLANLQPDRHRFPAWHPGLAVDMRQETLSFFKDLAWHRKRPLHELLNAQFSYLTPRLARHYGLAPAGSGLRRYDLAGVPSRGGLLTQGTLLTVGGDDASMVTRGLFVLHDLLFGEVGSPPPGLDTSPVPASPGRSRRAIAAERVESAACGGCHSRFEPLAYGLEKFDGLGSYQDVDEHGNRLGEDGEVLFPGAAEPVTYDSIGQLMELLAASDRVRQTITRKLAQFAVGRPLAAADEPAIQRIHREAARAGATYRDLVTAIATSELVLEVQTEP